MPSPRGIPDKSILLKRVRAFYTPRGCRVQTTYFTSLHGEIIEDIELSCMFQAAMPAVSKDVAPMVTPGPARSTIQGVHHGRN